MKALQIVGAMGTRATILLPAPGGLYIILFAGRLLYLPGGIYPLLFELHGGYSIFAGWEGTIGWRANRIEISRQISIYMPYCG